MGHSDGNSLGTVSHNPEQNTTTKMCGSSGTAAHATGRKESDFLFLFLPGAKKCDPQAGCGKSGSRIVATFRRNVVFKLLAEHFNFLAVRPAPPNTALRYHSLGRAFQFFFVWRSDQHRRTPLCATTTAGQTATRTRSASS